MTRLIHLEQVAESVMLGPFLRGSRKEINVEQQVLGPTTLDQEGNLLCEGSLRPISAWRLSGFGRI